MVHGRACATHKQHTCSSTATRPCGRAAGGVSAGVSPVELVEGLRPPLAHITVAMASCTAARLAGALAAVLPARAGTLCLMARGLSPGGGSSDCCKVLASSAGGLRARRLQIRRSGPPHCAHLGFGVQARWGSGFRRAEGSGSGALQSWMVV